MSIKIITGKLKNRNLFLPKFKDHQLRLTTGLVKKAVIDIYKEKLKDAVVLDLYAGIGNVGIEMLSNQTKKVIFIEKETKFCNAIKKNLERLGLEKEKYYVINNFVENSLKLLEHRYIFDFIYLDPPYKENLTTKTINLISKFNIYDKNTIIIAEHHYKENTEDTIGNFEKIDSRKYGMTKLDFFKTKN